MNKNIVLCGFMGCGKTTVGRLLAEHIGYRLVDMDEYIEAQAGMTVAAIFDRFGEEEFRRREREACVALAEKSGLVIATGGGALTFPDNARVLRETGVTVLLSVSPAAILRRLEGDTTRPLLARPDREAALQELYDRRLPLYRAAADIEVLAEDTPDAVADRVIAALKNLKK